MKRILFPTDFSEAATNALGNALAFAKKIQGELILLHFTPYYRSMNNFSQRI
jgi:nucleotide-binding universal stress UspA family protein